MSRLRTCFFTVFVLCVSLTVFAQEERILAEALDMCALDTTYYVSLETLNDSASASVVPAYDFINDGGGTFVIPPAEGKFLPTRVNLISAYFSWKGPYVIFQQGRTQLADGPYDKGTPLDPWGNPYYLFSPLGLVRGDIGSITLELYGDQFDRYTIVSLGPDGVKSSDDLLYSFGPPVTVPTISSLRGPRVEQVSDGPLARRLVQEDTPDYTVVAGTPLTIRGVHLADSQSSPTVMWQGNVWAQFVSTSPRELILIVPGSAQGFGALSVSVGSQVTNSVKLLVRQTTDAILWSEFE